MTTIEISHSDLQKLVGKKLPKESLQDILMNAKCEYEEIEGDIITVNSLFDRPDTFSTEGIARVLRGTFGVETGLKKYQVKASWAEVRVDRFVQNIRPFIKCAVMKNVELNEDAVKQLMQLQEKIHLSYARGRAKASIGIYDINKTKPPYNYTALAPKDIVFIPLEENRKMDGKEILEKTKKGREYAHLLAKFEKYPVLIDAQHKIMSMPPIINGEDTKVEENTKDLFIDVTGTDERVVTEILTTVVTLLAERGAEMYTVDILPKDEKTPKLEYRQITADTNYINQIIGAEFRPAEIKKLLEKQRFGCIVDGKKLNITIPCYRFDIMHPVDIAEEVAVAYGINELKPELPILMATGGLHPLERFSKAAREVATGLGYQEIATFVLSSKETIGERYADETATEIANPTSLEYCVLRNSLIPKLLEFLAANKHVESPQKIFEADDIILGSETRRRICFMSCHHIASYTEMKSTAEAFLSAFGKGATIESAKKDNFIPGRVGRILIKEKEVGIIGEIHPEVLNRFGLENPVACIELDLEQLLAEK